MSLTDTTGQPMPEIERPSAEKLRVYGDMLFLAFRSPRHTRMSVGALRSYFEPAVELGQFRIFRFDDIPRGMYTWAYLGPEAERKLVTGEPLNPQDWNSGDRLWIIDLIAPYRGLTASIVRWIMEPGHFTDAEFRFRRVKEANATQRIVHIDFAAPRLARVMTEAQFLAGLPGAT